MPRPGTDKMIDPENTIVVIPARMASRRLPGKPLADLAGLPLVIRTLRHAASAQLGPVLVAASDAVLADTVRRHGGDAIATNPKLSSGFLRMAQALSLRDPKMKIEHVLMLPCDLPFIDLLSLRRCLAGLTNLQVEIATLASPLIAGAEGGEEAVQTVIAPLGSDRELAWARDFPSSPIGSPSSTNTAGEDVHQHIPVFALRRRTIDRLAEAGLNLGLTDTAKQLGIRIAAVKVDSKPFRVDTPAQLEAARRMLRD